MVLSVGSLFSGIGGIELGLERTGRFRTIWQVESDEYATRVLERHWPKVPRYSDIRRIAVLPPVDLVCGGFPCQPVSLAGRRKGPCDPRWLWPEFARVVSLARPRYVLVENVPGLLSLGMAFVLADLAALGYDAEWTTLAAADVGAPHRRERVWIVAHVADTACERRARMRTIGHAFSDPDGVERILVRARQGGSPSRSSWWATEPRVGRMAHGVPHGVDRLRCLGNAVVPQVAEVIGRFVASPVAQSVGLSMTCHQHTSRPLSKRRDR